MGSYTPTVFPPRRANETIFDYRMRCAADLGFTKLQARALAETYGLDFSRIVWMLRHGATHQQVVRITI